MLALPAPQEKGDTGDVMGHRHPVNVAHVDKASFGQLAAERMAKAIGSWRFLIIQSSLLSAWIVLNVYELLTNAWDRYPFILLNLMLSFQAAYTGPILLIAANRGAERDRLALERDHELSEQHSTQLVALQDLLEENTEITRALKRIAHGEEAL